MKSGRWLVVFGSLVAIVLLVGMVASCEGTTSTTGTEGTATTVAADVPLSILECPQGPVSGETPQYGGTLKITYDHTPSNLGAFWDLTRFLDWVQARFAVESLVGLNPQGQPVPQLATSWDIDDVAKTITFHLREGVKFHDGTDFNAEAAKWNLDMQKNGPKTELKNVTDIAAVDPYTVRLTFSEMDPLFVQQMVASMCGKITSPAAYELYGPEEIKFQPVGTGPFKFDRFEPDVLLRYTRFEDYWQEGLPYLDAVEIHYIADNTVALTSFKSGEAQIMGNLGVKDVPELEAAGNTIQTRMNAFWCLAGDSANPDSPAADLRVRQAIAYAIDCKTITEAVWDGAYPYSNQLALPGMTGYNSAIKGYPFDPVRAAQLLAEVGITPETPWKTTLKTPNPEDRVEWLTVAQEQLREVGIEVELQPLPSAGYQEVSSNGWTGLAIVAFSYPMEAAYSSTLRQTLSEDAYMNPSIAVPEEFNVVYRAMLPETDLAKRELAYQQLNKMAIDDYCLLTPLFGLPGLSAVSADVHDSGFLVDCTPEFLPERAWLSGASNPGTTAPAGTTTSGQ